MIDYGPEFPLPEMTMMTAEETPKKRASGPKPRGKAKAGTQKGKGSLKGKVRDAEPVDLE